MARIPLTIPFQQFPLTRPDGTLTEGWYPFLLGLWRRTGAGEGLGSSAELDASDDPTLAGDSSTEVTTEHAVAGAFAARLKRATVSLTMPALAGVATAAHGLGAAPWHLSVWVVCLDPDLNWAVDDKTQAQGLQLWADATDVFVQVNDTAVQVQDKTSGTLGAIDLTKWGIEVRAQI